MSLDVKIEFGESRQMITSDEDFKLVGGEVLKYDLACGRRKKEGFLGIDKYPLEGVDLVHDLMEFPWPIKDESVYEFRAHHFVEHIPIQLKDGSYGLIRFMEEVYRCLMMYGTIEIICPYYMSCEAWQDPTHTRAITDVTFSYFHRSIVKSAGLDHYTGECNFEQISKSLVLAPEWNSRAEEARNYAIRYYWNVVKEIKVVLRKIPL